MVPLTQEIPEPEPEKPAQDEQQGLENPEGQAESDFRGTGDAALAKPVCDGKVRLSRETKRSRIKECDTGDTPFSLFLWPSFSPFRCCFPLLPWPDSPSVSVRMDICIWSQKRMIVAHYPLQRNTRPVLHPNPRNANPVLTSILGSMGPVH